MLTLPLETDVTLKLGYIARKGEKLEGLAESFVQSLTKNLTRYVKP